MTLDVPAPDAGSYQVRCTVPGHDQLGMTGTLVVVAGSGDAAAGQADTMDHMQHANMTAEEMATAHEAGVDARSSRAVRRRNRATSRSSRGSRTA